MENWAWLGCESSECCCGAETGLCPRPSVPDGAPGYLRMSLPASVRGCGTADPPRFCVQGTANCSAPGLTGDPQLCLSPAKPPRLVAAGQQ